MNTCQNPKCNTKYKSNNKKYCSSICYKQAETTKIKFSKPNKEKIMWRNFWEVKLRNAPLGKITKEEYEIYDYINNYQTFTNLRA